MSYKSTEINEITSALALAQGAYKKLVPNQDAPGGKFANLQAILESSREALSANGIAFSQYIDILDQGSGASLLWSTIMHSSGQWLASCARIVHGATFKETFNCVEGYRRMHALLLLGIAPSDRDPLIKDDNGTEEIRTETQKNLRNPDAVKPRSEFVDTITKEQYEDLMYELEGYDSIAKGIQKFYNLSTIADLPKSEYYAAQAEIRRLKKTHEEYKR